VGQKDGTLPLDAGSILSSFHAIVGKTHGAYVAQDVIGSGSWSDPRSILPAHTYTWDADGLWVGGLFDSTDLTAAPYFEYQLSSDMVQGELYTNPTTGVVYYYGCWENETRVYQITGWDNWTRQSGNVSATPMAPALTVQGNGVSIANGDTTPSTADGTDFGSATEAAAVDHTFTIRNTGTAEMNLTGGTLPVTFTTRQGGDFHFISLSATNILPGGSATLTVRFIPAGTGVRSATMTIPTDTGTPFTCTIQGTGVSDSAISTYTTSFILPPTAVTPGPGQPGMNGGEKITIGAQPITITSLGRAVAPGNVNAHTMEIFDDSTKSPVPNSMAVIETANNTAA
jgi:hypothetical protein